MVRPERTCLFGSVARGDAGQDSDYDILLVVPDDAPPELRRNHAAHVALWGTGFAADVLVWTTSEFDSRVHLPASLPATVLREGKLLLGYGDPLTSKLPATAARMHGEALLEF